MRERNAYPNPGIGNVGSYYVAGHPYVTGSSIDARSEVKIEFPFVAKSVKIKSVSEKEIRVHFTSKDEGDTYLSQRFKRLPSSGSVITLDSKCKEIYVSNPFSASAAGFHLFAELTHIDSGSMYSLTGTVNLSGAYGMPVPQGVTSWYKSINVDGSNNNTLSNGDRIDTWKDLSGNKFDLTQAGSERPTFLSADTSGDSPTFNAVEFDAEGIYEHLMSVATADADFEDILPSDGKSAYVVIHFDDNAGSYGGGSNKGLQPRLIGDVAYPSVFCLEFARYTAGGQNWDVVLIQNDTIIDSVQVGNGPVMPLNNSKFIISFRHDGTNYWMNSHNPTFTNGTSGSLANTPDATQFSVRKAIINSTMEYFEVITFNRKLTDTEHDAIINYLNNKWNVGV